MRPYLLIAVSWAAMSATAATADFTFTGYARDLDSGALLYVESHSVRFAGTTTEQRVVLYRRDEAVPPFARKTLTYGADRSRPAVDFQDQRSGYAESVSRDARGFAVVARTGPRAAPRTALIPGAEVAVVDAGFDEFVQANWNALEAGVVLEAGFLVPSRLDAVDFKVRKVGETSVGGARASLIRLSVAGPIGWFLSDIDVTYRQLDRRLLRYRGLTNIRDAQGKLLTAQIDFPDAARITAPIDLEALRALLLEGSPRQ